MEKDRKRDLLGNFWFSKQGTIGKYCNIYIERHVLGLWRVRYEVKNYFPKPKDDVFYFFRHKTAKKFARMVGERAALVWCHQVPDRGDIAQNLIDEPEGERIRRNLETFLARNNIAGLYIDTYEHTVDIQIAKLPPRMRSVLTKWGSIYVKDDRE